jgi:ribosomal protein S14
LVMTEPLQAQHLVPTSSFERLKNRCRNLGRQHMSISVE